MMLDKSLQTLATFVHLEPFFHTYVNFFYVRTIPTWFKELNKIDSLKTSIYNKNKIWLEIVVNSIAQ
jgi:hypothetical protein